VATSLAVNDLSHYINDNEKTLNRAQLAPSFLRAILSLFQSVFGLLGSSFGGRGSFTPPTRVPTAGSFQKNKQSFFF
jgi:hypothetical protein